MTKTAGFKFTVKQPNDEWHDVSPTLYKTVKGAASAGQKYVVVCAEEGWETQFRIENVPALAAQ